MSTTEGEGTELVQVILERDPRAPLVLTCEHASEALPAGVSWLDEDSWLRGTHWAFDLGAAHLTRELARKLGAGAVLAGFSRLFCDANRPLDSDTLVRTVAEGRTIAMNVNVDGAALDRRLVAWHAYHRELDALFAASAAPLALSLHSFTPLYEGTPRSVEVGVLFDREEALAVELCARFKSAGFETRLNEPYSGKEGLIYSVSSHASVSGRRALELELRQDLAVEPGVRATVVRVLAEFARTAAADAARGVPTA